MSSEVEVLTYGNWRHPVTPGIGRFSLAQTMSMFGGAIVVVLVQQIFGLGPAVLLGLVIAGGALLASIRDKHGMNISDRMKERRMFRRAKKKQANHYRSGVLTPTRTGSGASRLPGMAGKTTLSEHEDAHRRRFAVVHHADGRLSVVMSLAPTGVGLVDQEMIDRQVALWGMWLAELADQSGVVDASVTVETAPDTGARLRREVASRTSQEAPQVAREIIASVVDVNATSGAQIKTWATISFQPSRMSTERRGRTGRAIKEIATRLPGITQSLSVTGAGAVHLLSMADLCRMARIAYDPEIEQVLDASASEGMEVALGWDQVGPVGAHASWDHYRHDSGLSRSWTMTRPPRSAVQSDVLARLLDVSGDVERKRVTILYRPMDSAKAPDVVERDVDKAVNAVRTSKKPTERKLRDVASARQTSREEAAGAALVDFGIIATVTVSGQGSDAERRLADASAALESMAGASRILLRPAFGAQDSAFALCLPLGLSPARATLSGEW